MSERGFTLLETMVALFVFSIAATGLLTLNTQSIRLGSQLETRTLARTVAENVAVDTVTGHVDLARPVETGEQVQRRRTYEWQKTIEAAPRSGLYTVQIQVRELGEEGVLAQLSFLTSDTASP